jgi:hypothetical protein
MRSAPALGATLALVGLASCNADGGVGYVEIKTVPAATPVALYLDTLKLEPVRNGMAVLQQKVGTAKLQVDADGGQFAVLCNIVVQKNRITSVTVSTAGRQLRCQCNRSSTGKDLATNRTCVA